MLTTREKRLLQCAEEISDVTEIAKAVLRRMKSERREKRLQSEIIMICGPMANGGLGLEANLERFRLAIKRAKKEGFLVFDQLPFQEVLNRTCPQKKNGNNVLILGGFYRPLFESRFFERAFFLPEWQTSFGARWEKSLLQQLRIPVEDVPAEWLV